jgi:predicted dehydrogenase
MSTKKIRVGIIGVGNWGRYGHMPVLQLLPSFQMSAVASPAQGSGRTRLSVFWCL